MMTEEEKFLLAKNRYETIMAKLASIPEKPVFRLRAAYVHLTDQSVIQDFYWSDQPITPTKFYRWIRTYNNPTIKKPFRATKVVLEPALYKELISMYANPSTPLIVNDVVVTF